MSVDLELELITDLNFLINLIRIYIRVYLRVPTEGSFYIQTTEHEGIKCLQIMKKTMFLTNSIIKYRFD